MAEQLLTGCDGELYYGTEGTPLSDTGTLTADTEYIINATGSGSALSSSLVGYLYKADGTETLVTGDTVTPVTFDRVGFINSWELNATKDKYEVTQLGVCTKGYIDGLSEITATFNGTLDLQDGQQDRVNNYFFNQVEDNATVSEVQSGDLLTKLVVNNKSTASGEKNQFYFGPLIQDNFTTNSSSDTKDDFNYNGTINGSGSVKFARYTETVA